MHGTLKDASRRPRQASPSLSLDNLHRHAEWRDRDLVLYGKTIVSIEPASKWPGIWRVRCGGQLSDMVNLTRAKDAAKSIALSQLNSAKAA
jgi:hypothetical protein